MFLDLEMNPLLDKFVDSIMPNTVYNKKLVNSNTNGVGWWAYTMICVDAISRKINLRSELAGTKIPALILKGDADYVPEAAAHQYEEVFVNSKFVRIEKAGHLIWANQPKIYDEQVTNFLKD